MIDGSEKRNRQLAFELQNSHVCEKCSKALGNSRGQKGMSQNIKFLERQVNDATITKKEQTHVIDHLKLCPVQ